MAFATRRQRGANQNGFSKHLCGFRASTRPLKVGIMAPIHVAARNMDVDALRLELERGVDPNLREGNSLNKTPLQLIHCAPAPSCLPPWKA